MFNGENETGLKVDDAVHAHLKETAAWARFIGVFGIVTSILMAIVGLAGSAYLAKMPAAAGSPMISPGMMSTLYVIIAAVYFFLSILLNKFADNMKLALQSGSQSAFHDSFLNLKYVYRFLGVILIAYVCLIFISIVIAAFGAAS